MDPEMKVTCDLQVVNNLCSFPLKLENAKKRLERESHETTESPQRVWNCKMVDDTWGLAPRYLIKFVQNNPLEN